MSNFIYQFSLENFKVFSKKTIFRFSPVTILTGPNSSGKSSISQAIRLFSGMYRRALRARNSFSLSDVDFFSLTKGLPFGLIGDRAGEFQNLISGRDERKMVSFSIPVRLDSSPAKFELSVKFSASKNVLQGGRFENLKIADEAQQDVRFHLFRRTADKSQKSKLVNPESAVFVKCDYLAWYLDYIRLRERVKTLEKNLQELDRQKDLLNKVDENLREETKSLLIELYGSGYKEHDLVFYDLEWEWFDFGINKLSFDRIIRRIPKYLKEFSSPEFILDLNFLFAKKYHSAIIKQIDSIFPQEFLEYSNVVDRINLKILKILANTDLRVYGEQEEHDGLIATSVYSEVFYPEAQVFSILEKNLTSTSHLSAKAVSSKSKLGFRGIGSSLAGESKSPIFTKFGNIFFTNIKIEVSDCLDALGSFPVPHQFDGELRINRSRSVVLSTRNADAVDLIRFFSYGKNELKVFQDFINEWLILFEAGERIRFDQAGQNLQILIEKDNRTFNLTDEGQGISLLIHLLIRICTVAELDATHGWMKKLVVLEEPENGLHPALQSKLAELFYAVYKKFNIQVIAETHSEYLIRQLQVMVAKEEITPDIVQIYYLHKPGSVPEGCEQVMPINIMDDGSLSRNFSRGFFDESSSLSLAMYLFGGSRKN